MRFLLSISLACFLAGGAMAQRGGGGGGGMRGGGGMGGGAGMGHGPSGGMHGSGGFSGGAIHNGGGFHNGAGFGFGSGNRAFNGFGFTSGHGFFGGGFYGYPYYSAYYSPLYWGGLSYGLGYGYGYPGYYDYGYSYPYSGGYAYDGYASSPATYSGSSGGVTVVYPPPSNGAQTVYTDQVHPVTHEYDQYGQEVRSSGGGSAATGSPIYLIAFKDHVIRAASSYSVEGSTLHFVTIQHESRTAPLDQIDRDLTMQLNRERRVQIQLP